VTVIGPVTALIHGVTSGVSTDWVVKLCDVDERGRTINVCDGIVRTDPGEAGTRVASQVDMWGTAIVFRPGHRIRVIVTSSDFPRYERNPNTGQNPWETTVLEPALQRVFHEGERASHVVLPTIS
jgi:putative CocE/NonD family hydrolase